MGVAGQKPQSGGEVERRAQSVDTGDIVAMEPPDDLSEDGRLVWNVLLPDLIASKVFRLSDALLLSELCESLGMARAFRREIALLVPQMEEAYQKIADAEPGPEFAAACEWGEFVSAALKRARTGYRQMMQTMMSIAGEFGISPVARLRLGLMKAQGAKLTDFFGKGDDGAET